MTVAVTVPSAVTAAIGDADLVAEALRRSTAVQADLLRALGPEECRAIVAAAPDALAGLLAGAPDHCILEAVNDHDLAAAVLDELDDEDLAEACRRRHLLTLEDEIAAVADRVRWGQLDDAVIELGRVLPALDGLAALVERRIGEVRHGR